MYTERPNHEPSLFMLNCGDKLPGRPSMGSWLTYGLGTENQNLPGFVVLCPGLAGDRSCALEFDVPARGPPGDVLPLGEKDPKKLIGNSKSSPERRQAAQGTGLAGQVESHSHGASGRRSELEAQYPIRRDCVPNAEGSAGSVRHHEGARADARSAMEMRTSVAAA